MAPSVGPINVDRGAGKPKRAERAAERALCERLPGETWTTRRCGQRSP
jgi:hypothetical protein